MKIIEKDINDLIAAEYNPRQMTADQVQALTDSIKRFGLVDPIIINRHKDRMNIIIGGHQRVRIARELGIKTVFCVEVELTPEAERELNIRLNKNTGEWDWDALANYFDVGELTEWGFSDDDLQFYVDEPGEGLIDDDEVPEVTEAIAKTGDLWILGEHRVLCGDATKKEDVERLMDGKKADMVFTDPPYGVNYKSQIQSMNYNGKKGKQRNIILGDETTDIIIDFMPILKMFVNGVAYVFCGAGKEFDLLKAITDNKYEHINTLVWNKPKGTMALGANYKPCFEMFFYLKIKGERNWSGNHSEWTVWDVEYKKDNSLHPTQKPVALAEKAINNHNAPIVLDLFGGSGSTLIACEKLNRKCYGMEIDPHYCDVIVKRWEEFTGKKAELDN